ncbi:SDR family oxidoreductase [Flagellimonas zhangzhouensis]|uniref:NAD(P)H dehydrogenase (Quinone) n=1 Tax=Flagellimonas zhangzhouensis TaxID=1073328 RepID=A0A1H2SKS4_9FLAO|nr:SDR family oxidoreductase [Allomuricauda zhangzhouensis]SDQ75977.1 NAD(P)H dehydrogenase (quinone) [Allomuricauda zhangzhouensis]SDW32117.1 NAD(P)H dehydrogenase (quinone) [Allomuricauda zhangzhouensis]
MAKILITGATGGLGGTTAKLLKEKIDVSNIAVLVRDKESDKARALAAEGFELRLGDYDNLEALKEAFKGVDTLYFVSASDIGKRIPQHKNVVEAATASGVKHILYTSTVRKDESSDAPLFAVVDAHIKTEEWIKESGLTYTLLRHNLYAELIPMFLGAKEQLLQSKTIYLPTGNGKTSFVPREDFAEAEANILADPSKFENKILEFNGSEQTSFEEVSKLLTETLVETIGYVSPEVDEFKTTMASYQLPEEIIGMLTMFSLGIANGEFDQTTDDLESVLGRKTKTISTFLSEVYS